jgi:hypothetical protein
LLRGKTVFGRELRLSLWLGVVAVAFGEVIGVLFAIEENTRAAVAVSKAA